MDRQTFDARAEALRTLHIRALQDGAPVFTADYDGEIRRNQYSATKSFTSIAVGIAVREGLLSLNERLTDAFPGDLPKAVCENLQKATVRDLLTMCIGHSRGYLMAEERFLLKETDWVKYALRQEKPFQPGSHFQYDNIGPHLAGILVQRRAGCTLDRYLTPRLFEPLGIPHVTWETDPMGYSFGAGGLFLAVSELLRFGQLLLQEGFWNGRQLVPADYIREAAENHAPEDAPRYGYLFWLGENGSYRADGKYGQYAFVLPADRAVIAVNAEARDQDALRQFVLENKAFILGGA